MSTAPVIHVLGSGTCHPVPGGKRRAHPGFFVRWGEGNRHLLIECSQMIAERLETIGEDPYDVRHLAISHAHPDHYALPQFVQTAFCAGLSRANHESTELAVYGSAHVVNTIRDLNRIYFEETVTAEKAGLSSPRIVQHCLQRSGGGATLACDGSAHLAGYSVYHGFGKVDALALRLTLPDGRVIAYSGDTGWCDGLTVAARDADLFICEASAAVDDESMATGYGHLNPRQAAEAAKRAGAKKLVLTHYSGRDSDKAMLEHARRSEFEGEIVVAKDGDRYHIV